MHAYSRQRMEGFLDHVIPEITRVPLVDVCLYVRLLIREEIRMQQFFGFLLDGGPPSTNVQQSITVLQSIGALDSDSNQVRVRKVTLVL